MSGSGDKVAHFTAPVAFGGSAESFSHELSYVRKLGKSKLWVLHQGIASHACKDVLRAVFFGALMKPVLGDALVKIRMNHDQKSYATEYIPDLSHDGDFSAYTKFSVNDLIRMRFPFICGALKAVGEVDFHGLNIGVSNGHFIVFDTDYWGYFFSPEVNYAIYEPTVSAPMMISHRQYGINGDEHLGPHHWPDSRYYNQRTNLVEKTAHDGPIRELYNDPEALFQQYEAMLGTILLPAPYVQAVQNEIVKNGSDVATSSSFNFMSHQKRLLGLLLDSWRFCSQFLKHYDEFKNHLSKRFKEYNKHYENETGELKPKYTDSKLVLPVDDIMEQLSDIQQECILRSMNIDKAVIDFTLPHDQRALIHYGSMLTCLSVLPESMKTDNIEQRFQAIKSALNEVMLTECVRIELTARQTKFKSLHQFSSMIYDFQQFMHIYQEIKAFLRDDMKLLYRQTCNGLVQTAHERVTRYSAHIKGALHTSYTGALDDGYYVSRIDRVLSAAWRYACALFLSKVEIGTQWTHALFNEYLPMLLEKSPFPLASIISHWHATSQSHMVGALLKKLIAKRGDLATNLELLKAMIAPSPGVSTCELRRVLESELLSFIRFPPIDIALLRGLSKQIMRLGGPAKDEAGEISLIYKNSLEALLASTDIVIFSPRLRLYYALAGAINPMPTLEEFEMIEAKFFEILAGTALPAVPFRVILEILLKYNAHFNRLVNPDKFTESYFAEFNTLTMNEQVSFIGRYCRNFALVTAYVVAPLPLARVAVLLDQLKPIDPQRDAPLYQCAHDKFLLMAQGDDELLSKIGERFHYEVGCRPVSVMTTASSTSFSSPLPFMTERSRTLSEESAGLSDFGPIDGDVAL